MKSTIISILIAIVFIAGSFYLVNRNSSSFNESINVDNVSMVDGKQIIDIDARGGYSPRVSQAKAGLPTIIRFNTKNTFDCSASIRIPSMKISKMLPNTGSTDIDIGIQVSGRFRGSCGMGMYPFEIEFVS